jgi:hypothetical protein
LSVAEADAIQARSVAVPTYASNLPRMFAS